MLKDNVDFPDPVLPTIPTFSLEDISKFMPYNTKGNSGLYFIATFFPTIFPIILIYK